MNGFEASWSQTFSRGITPPFLKKTQDKERTKKMKMTFTLPRNINHKSFTLIELLVV